MRAPILKCSTRSKPELGRQLRICCCVGYDVGGRRREDSARSAGEISSAVDRAISRSMAARPRANLHRDSSQGHVAAAYISAGSCSVDDRGRVVRLRGRAGVRFFRDGRPIPRLWRYIAGASSSPSCANQALHAGAASSSRVRVTPYPAIPRPIPPLRCPLFLRRRARS